MLAGAAVLAVVFAAPLQGQSRRTDQPASLGSRAGLPRDMRQVRLVRGAPESARHRPPAARRSRASPFYGHHGGLGLFAPTLVVGIQLDAPGPSPDSRESVAPESKVIDVAAVLLAGSIHSPHARTAAPGDSVARGGLPARIESVAWLEGCWEAASPRRTIEERWTAPRGGSMLGTSRTLRNDTLLEHEFITLREVDGWLAYQAQPSGQPAAAFRATRISDSTVVFENPGHDFPQLIGYRRTAADSLHAWIQGTGSNGPRQVNFAYGRVACER